MTDTETVPGIAPETASALPGFAPQRVAAETVAETLALSMGPGAFRTDDHRYYWNGIGPFPSVTTIIGILNKPSVVTWKARETAKATIANWVEVSRLIATEGQDAAVNWAVKESDKARDTAANLGSSVHLLADMVGASETAVDGFPVSEEVIPYLTAFRGFLDRYSRSAIVSSEKMVWSLNGYAGTYDLLMQLPTDCSNHDPNTGPGSDYCVNCGQYALELWLIDIKTSKGYYPEYGLQLAAYRYADQIILPGDPRVYPMPQIQRTGVLHLRPDQYPDTGWRLIEYPTSDRDWIAFLGALEVYIWSKEGRFTKSILNRQKP